MTIRYKCEECGVAMKIKDDLAGKKGKCPQCKTNFVIPHPEDELPVDDVPVPEDEPDEDEEDDEDEDDDDLLDMPLELTAAPVTSPPPPAAAAPAARSQSPGRKKASETKKATRMSSGGSRKAKATKSNDGEFDPADFLMGDDDGGSGSSDTPAVRPRGRVGGLDDEEEEVHPDDVSRNSSSMAEMFQDFVPAGGAAKRNAADVDSTSVASQALARAAEEKKNRASLPTPVEEDEDRLDIVQVMKDLGSQYGLYVGGALALIVGAYAFMFFGLSDDKDIPELHTVRGIVTEGGTPVVGAEIVFSPVINTRDDMAAANAGGMVISKDGGEFEVEYLPGYWGLPAATYTVQVTRMGLPLGKVRSVTIEPDKTNEVPLQF